MMDAEKPYQTSISTYSPLKNSMLNLLNPYNVVQQMVLRLMGSSLMIFCTRWMVRADATSQISHSGLFFYTHTPNDVPRGVCLGIGLATYHSLSFFLNIYPSVVFAMISFSIAGRFVLINACAQVQLGWHYWIGVIFGYLIISLTTIGVSNSFVSLLQLICLYIPISIGLCIFPPFAMIGQGVSFLLYPFLYLEEVCVGHWTH